MFGQQLSCDAHMSWIQRELLVEQGLSLDILQCSMQFIFIFVRVPAALIIVILVILKLIVIVVTIASITIIATTSLTSRWNIVIDVFKVGMSIQFFVPTENLVHIHVVMRANPLVSRRVNLPLPGWNPKAMWAALSCWGASRCEEWLSSQDNFAVLVEVRYHQGSHVHNVFEGRTPCEQIARLRTHGASNAWPPS